MWFGSFSLLLHVSGRFAGRVLRQPSLGLMIILLTVAVLPAETQATEKLKSPDGKYTVEVVRGESLLIVSKDEAIVAKILTPVGPEGSFFQTMWSPDGRYVAINKQRNSRPFPGPGGDCLWIVALATGKVLRRPDDALWNEVEKKAWAFIDEKHLTDSGGKAFLTLTASGWENSRLRFKLEAAFSEIEDRYVFAGLLNPSDPEAISDWKVSKAKS